MVMQPEQLIDNIELMLFSVVLSEGIIFSILEVDLFIESTYI